MSVGPIRDWHEIGVELFMTEADLALQAITALLDDRDAVTRLVHHA
jgi:hypothetical protein